MYIGGIFHSLTTPIWGGRLRYTFLHPDKFLMRYINIPIYREVCGSHKKNNRSGKSIAHPSSPTIWSILLVNYTSHINYIHSLTTPIWGGRLRYTFLHPDKFLMRYINIPIYREVCGSHKKNNRSGKSIAHPSSPLCGLFYWLTTPPSIVCKKGYAVHHL